MSKLTTQVLNAFKASGASEKSIETLQTITRKMKGQRSEKLKPPTDKSIEDNRISVSQLSYANRASNFAAMVSLLLAEPKYAPNEYNLTVTGLQEKLDALNSTYQAVSLAQAPLAAIRIRRLEALYHAETGLIHTVKLVKAYIKSLYGAKSAQYKQVTTLAFKGRKL
jgi:predicted negative regulator of RcsB-dependent stress response